MGYWAVAYLGLVAALSLVSFLVYGFDKHRASAGGRRVPEQTLHLLALLGGWPGALLGQRRFRHKTRKVPFLIAFWASVMLHVAVVGVVVFLFLTRSGAAVARPAESTEWRVRIEPGKSARPSSGT